MYPYLRVIAPTVLERRPDGISTERSGLPLASAAALSTVAVVLVGVGAEPLLSVAQKAVGA